MRLSRVAPRILRQLWRGFWHRMWWKYVVQSFSPVALMFFSGLACVLFGVAVGVFVLVNTLGPAGGEPPAPSSCLGAVPDRASTC